MPKGQYTRKPRNSQPSPQPEPQKGSAAKETVTTVRPAHIDSGTDARGSTNARTNQTRTQPEPDAAVRAMGEVVSLRGKRSRAPSLLTETEAQLSETVARKTQLEQEARQHIAQAIDLIKEGEGKEEEAAALIDRASMALYRCRIEGQMSADALTGVLGDQFGFKDKTDATKSVPAGHPNASKTPFKRGEAIRKRIVRAVQANEYANGRDGGAFFNELPKEEVQATLNAMTDGKLGFWAAYEKFAEVKRTHDAAKAKIDAAYDPKKVAAFAEKLNAEGAAKLLLANGELVRSYVTLHSMIEVAMEKAAALRGKAA
jgi:hypothetical protein